MSGFEIDEPEPAKHGEPSDTESVWGKPPPDDLPQAPPRPAQPPSAPAPAPPAAPPPAAPHEHPGEEDMRQVEEVRNWILDRVPVLAPIELPLQEAQGCVMAGDVVAQMDLPPFSSSAMDGFAVRSADVAEAHEDQVQCHCGSRNAECGSISD